MWQPTLGQQNMEYMDRLRMRLGTSKIHIMSVNNPLLWGDIYLEIIGPHSAIKAPEYDLIPQPTFHSTDLTNYWPWVELLTLKRPWEKKPPGKQLPINTKKILMYFGAEKGFRGAAKKKRKT